MSRPAIKIENVSKRYRLGEVGTGTLSHDLNRAWARLRGKPDPFALVGDVNDREKAGGDYVWALKDINLEVQEGEMLGIIGSNGAGKSTLLKLLSRVTAPTTGTIRARGRIASLLEVGTGFHPELTGRENIYLNGALLGMRRREVTRRLEEIVEFSGCAKYLDTPVKRYSSGMMVRLGFSVAANLECEILIVDEVLAVGDAEFQKKCIGKMKDVAGRGRTVLFVSHNMASVASLCTKAFILENGAIQYEGGIEAVVAKYIGRKQLADPSIESCRQPNYIESSKTARFAKVEMHDEIKFIRSGSEIIIDIELESSTAINGLTVAGTVFDVLGDRIATFFSPLKFDLTPGRNQSFALSIAGLALAPGSYQMGLSLGFGNERTKRKHIDAIIGVPRFEIDAVGTDNVVLEWPSSWGKINITTNCNLIAIDSDKVGV